MSYSLEEPAWPPVCECQYDPERDEMDRGNCQLHCSLEEPAEPKRARIIQKTPQGGKVSAA